MSGDILQTPDAPKPQGALDNYFKILPLVAVPFVRKYWLA